MITEVTLQEYGAFLEEQADYSFLQTPGIVETIRANGYEVKLLANVVEEKIRAVGLAYTQKIFMGTRMDMMAGAVAASQDDELSFYDALKTYCHHHRISQVIIQPDMDYRYYDLNMEPTSEPQQDKISLIERLGYQHDESDASILNGIPTYQYLKDLSPFNQDANALLKSFNKNSQRKIKKAIELGITVRQISYDEIPAFRDITTETAERQGFKDKSLVYYQAMYQGLGDKVEFLQAELNLPHSMDQLTQKMAQLNPEKKQDQQKIASLQSDIDAMQEVLDQTQLDIIPLANMVMVYLPDQATYFLGGSLTEYQKFPAAFLLQYEAMKRTMERHIPLYNFYGILGVFDGSDGVLRFKQNFNGYIVEKIGSFVYYPHPKRTKGLEKSKNIMNKILHRG